MEDEDIRKADVILYSLRDITSLDKELDLIRIGRILCIKKSTLNRYLKDLDRKGWIRIARNGKGRIESVILTGAGLRECEQTDRLISNIVLDPKSSGFSKRVPLQYVLDQLKGPYEIMEFLDLYFIKTKTEVTAILDNIKSMRQDSRISRYIDEVFSLDSGGSTRTLEDILNTLSIYGIGNENRKIAESLYDSNIDSLLLKAEILRRKGLIEEAKAIYDGLLHRRTGLESGRWILCLSGLVQCMVYLNQEKDGIELIERMIESIENPAERGFLKKVKADIVQGLGRFKEASDLYKSCLGLFQAKCYPTIRASILNNLGVLYFRKDEIEIATKLWEEAYDILIKEKLRWSICMTSINLADAYSLQGETRKASRLLGRARTFLEEVGDLEGLSEVDFNMALLQIEKGNRKKALKNFDRAMEFPLIYYRKAKEREEVFKGRMESKKW